MKSGSSGQDILQQHLSTSKEQEIPKVFVCAHQMVLLGLFSQSFTLVETVVPGACLSTTPWLLVTSQPFGKGLRTRLLVQGCSTPPLFLFVWWRQVVLAPVPTSSTPKLRALATTPHYTLWDPPTPSCAVP